jgi:signal transduction histidine kinase
MAAAVCGVWALAIREYNMRLDRFQRELANVDAGTTALVKTSINHVEMLRREAEVWLAMPSAPESAQRLFSALKPVDGLEAYALERSQDGQHSEQVADLTGAGALPTAASDVGREIQAALALNPLFQMTHEQLPDSAWIYYVSKNRFSELYPWAPSHELRWSDAVFGYDFYKLGTPEQNPSHGVFWTDVYFDTEGKGLMATVGEPVYDSLGQFRGTVDLDLTLGSMSRFLAVIQSSYGRVLLVNDRNQVIADSKSHGAPPTALTALTDLLPDSTSLRDAALANRDFPGTFERHGAWLMQTQPIDGTRWRLLLIIDHDVLLLKVLQSIWIGIAGLVVLGIALLAFEQRRRTAGALAENVVALEDTTVSLAHARDEAVQADRTKSMLLANVSHELRTPLNAIIGFSDVMRQQVYGPLGNTRYAEYAGHIQRSGEMLLVLINDLLDATRLEAGRYELQESDCALPSLIGEAVDLMRLQAEQSGITLETQIDAEMPSVFADERALRQITLNLLSNAVKFTPRDGLVTISCRLNLKGQPTLVVTDTGRGISAEEIQKLFRPFARASECKRSLTPGTGLGLAIVKSLVDLHQGTIVMESRVDIGTTVTVTLQAERIKVAA